jgi:hypothetical protein
MKNLFALKTTLVGLIFLLLAFDYELTGYIVKVEDPKELYFVGGLVIGLALLFAPDDLIGGIKSLIKKKSA